ncbi:MAG: hypothetical protein FD123_252 [Bacteroidetes bacterium]|nr:MAG: hypothetical protein FD123_252 [Bacteroidota bacterium]
MIPGSILFFSDKTRFSFRNRAAVRAWLLQVIKKEKALPGDISYIFTSDKSLLGINKQFLQHDFFTDVITFDYCTREKGKQIISGEIYISIDRVKDNARRLKISTAQELHRVMVHGLLHLCGHGDKTQKQQKTIRRLEDFYLSLLIL